ncbi:GGDEF domain-containing protein, partial [Candidatus Woesearchaeota archaeon]|nr:GGDEF domain-containing protein [Candidatus Woesearchaeota archaeon]
DIDFFKVYNDTNGHLAGDALLKELAELIQAKLRPSDIIGRYGGEEFIVILPEINSHEAEEVAERLRKAVEEHNFKYQECQPNKKVTVSIGLTTIHTKEMRREEILKETDKNLYASKKAGRNKVTSSVILKNGYVTAVNP